MYHISTKLNLIIYSFPFYFFEDECLNESIRPTNKNITINKMNIFSVNKLNKLCDILAKLILKKIHALALPSYYLQKICTQSIFLPLS